MIHAVKTNNEVLDDHFALDWNAASSSPYKSLEWGVGGEFCADGGCLRMSMCLLLQDVENCTAVVGCGYCMHVCGSSAGCAGN